eukprot:CAMPEP_0197457732 /NCGR_PEP_ID=MMETSP1175-20131217/46904_1 /TAXON_ID=1003142 /ORGANISM="Triceratium dubium, Strain CCMP147" /LENGTH=70 /DNA_ID=CAMNT_0042992171 /DNA_START=53 /DNA_END=262 /DNA_ORIENTATION=+
MKVAPAAVLCLAFLAEIVTSDNAAAPVLRRTLRDGRTPESSSIAEDTATDQDAAFWERELGGNGSHGKGK